MSDKKLPSLNHRPNNFEFRKRLIVSALPGLFFLFIGLWLGPVDVTSADRFGDMFMPALFILIGMIYSFPYILDTVSLRVTTTKGLLTEITSRDITPSGRMLPWWNVTEYRFSIGGEEFRTKDSSLVESVILNERYEVWYGNLSKTVLNVQSIPKS